MKAMDILEWVVYEKINGELLNIVDIPNGQSEEWWYDNFGNTPPCPVEGGKYLYFFGRELGYDWGEDYMYPDTSVELGDGSYIYFYLIED